jgi:hypothetical protein
MPQMNTIKTGKNRAKKRERYRKYKNYIKKGYKD